MALVFLGALTAHLAKARWPQVVRRVATLTFTLWLALILLATLAASDSSTGGGGVWLSPGIDTLRASSEYVTPGEKEMVVRQWAANALMFLPLPVLLSRLRPGFSAMKCFVLCAGLGFLIESTQLLQGNGRVVDLDDALCNALGVGVGLALNAAATALVNRRDRGRVAAAR
ncbi:VanZ family protein [Streptomyces sp. NPDC049944]|uniref:VanZ family protein n=1 Tax=Streptomyces sp. NPDC049944 TaxID=3155657 RepID=UPI00342F7D16